MLNKVFVPLRRMSQINRLCCCIENETNLPFEERDHYVGIQENVGRHAKLNALVKHRYSHFHVNEIGLEGKIVHLTDLSHSLTQPADLAPDEPFYVHFTVYKERVAHPELLDYLVRTLGINAGDIGHAGIKDKWGMTTQKMSIRNVDPQRLVALNQRNRHVKLGNFTYEKHPIASGDLMGNHFKIMLLDVNINSASDSSSVGGYIDTAVSSLKNFGFVNYYGRQRFDFDNGSQIIGKTMVQMNWEQVFDLVLRPRDDEPDFIRAAKNLWFAERDPIKIVKNLPPYVDNHHNKLREIWLLQGLAKHYDGGKGDLIEAYKTIPKYMRQLNYAAIKSFFWNHLVSFRIRTFGLKPIPGDIVSLRSATRRIENIESTGLTDDRIVSELLSHEIKTLTDSDFDTNGNCRDFTIYDVILDSPGSRMTAYTNPQVQSYFETLLEINQLKVDSFAKFMQKFAEEIEPVNHIRTFRHIVHRPINLTYKIVPYAQKYVRDLDRFIPSELDRLPTNHTRREKRKSKNDDKDRIGVLLEFSLLKGTYATIALRELLNCTSTWK